MNKKRSKKSRRSKLTTHSATDKLQCLSGIGDLSCDRQIVERLTPLRSVFTESVIQHLCTMIEPDPIKRNKLYYYMCDQLHDMKLLDSTYTMDEFEAMRGKYQMAIYQLVTLARSAMGCNTIMQNPTIITDARRYVFEFEEISFLGSGGFGNVFKARHRLDGNEYAVKKICVRPNRIEKIYHHLEEVKTLAKFDHTNIVTYKGAWIEKTSQLLTATPQNSRTLTLAERTRGFDTRSFNKLAQKRSRSVVTQRSDFESVKDTSRNCQSESFYIKSQSTRTSVVSTSESHESVERLDSTTDGVTFTSNIITERFQQLNSSTSIIGKRIEEQSNSKISDSDSDVVSFRHDKSQSDTDSKKKSCSASEAQEINSSEETEDSEACPANKTVCQYNSSMQQELAILYIQMSLCDQTLREWLDERREVTPDSIVRQILSQILAGLQHIHSRNTVHHDIKPKNIFITTTGELRIQLGDFGLACPLEHESRHHPNHGTQMYAAPEQLKGKCDPKSDVYSLGVVLFEILVPMQTYMECCDQMTRFKEGNTPEILANQPNWVDFLKKLLNIDSTKRPTATELLFELSKDKDVIIAKSDKRIHDLERENEKLRNELEKLRLSKQD